MACRFSLFFSTRAPSFNVSKLKNYYSNFFLKKEIKDKIFGC